MTLSEIRTLVYDRKRVAGASFVSDDEITRYFNERLRRIHRQGDYEWSTVSTSFSFTSGTTTYALSSLGNVKTMVDLYYNNVNEFTFVNPSDFVRLSAQGGNYYSIDGSNFLVNTGFGSGTLTAKFYTTDLAQTSGGSFIAELSTSTDSPIFPERFHDILSDFAMTRIFQKESKVDDYKIALNDFTASLRALNREFPSRAKRSLNRFKSIRDIGNQVNRFSGKDNILNM